MMKKPLTRMLQTIVSRENQPYLFIIAYTILHSFVLEFTSLAIPDEYAAKIFNIGGKRSDSWISGEKGRVFAVPVTQNKSFSARWSGTSGSKGKRNRRRGKR